MHFSIEDLNRVDKSILKLDIHQAISVSKDLITTDPQYNLLTGRLLVCEYHQRTRDKFSETIEILNNRVINGVVTSILDPKFYEFVINNKNILDYMVNYDRDYLLDTMGFYTIVNQYALKVDNKPVERLQDIYLRVSIVLSNYNIDSINEIYEALSLRMISLATPILLNCGTINQQLSSCFILSADDSQYSINKIACDAAKIGKSGGGIGINMQNIRSNGSPIAGTNGTSSGLPNFLCIMEAMANAYDQGGKRKSSFAIYVRDFHPDVRTVIQMKNPMGTTTRKTLDTFYGLCISDLLWKKVASPEDEYWYFIDPTEDERLNNMYGEEFETLYNSLVEQGRYKSKILAKDFMNEIIKNQFECGVPYIMNYDNVNKRNNLSNYSNISCLNLCAEIALPSNTDEYGVCNLGSIVLPSYVSNGVVDYKSIVKYSSLLTKIMDRLIDITTYPLKETAISNKLHRPIGVGVCGYADLLNLIRIPYESKEALGVTSLISECIYYGCLTMSTQLAKEISKRISKNKGIAVTMDGTSVIDLFNIVKSYKTVEYNDTKANYNDIPISRYNHGDVYKMCDTLGVYPSYSYNGGCSLYKGVFPFENWDIKEKRYTKLDWSTLRAHIAKFGVRNSLLTAQMPTATTAQIASCNEGVEAFTSNLYKRYTMSGDFVIINKYLIEDLIALGIWNSEMRNYLVNNNGSIQNIDGIPSNIKNMYKTSWDMNPMIHVKHARARAPFLDHSQSLNLFIPDTENDKTVLFSCLYNAWKSGLKTSNYYIRTQAIGKPMFIKTNVTSSIENTNSLVEDDEEEICLLCGV